MKTEIRLGQLPEISARRDAIHIAIAPVIATEKLYPGQDIGFVEDGNIEKVGTKAKQLIGIVDPFLKSPVFPEQVFWMCLYPLTVTSMRHEWGHPAFEQVTNEVFIAGPRKPSFAEMQVEESKQWLADFGMDYGLNYFDLLRAAEDYLSTGQTFYVGANSTHLPEEFWDHFERVTGKSVEENRRLTFFSCAC